MIIKINHGDYNLVKSDQGKRIRVVGEEQFYSEATEFVDKPREYEEENEAVEE